jgi:LacI family transcriptional regulator
VHNFLHLYGTDMGADAIVADDFSAESGNRATLALMGQRPDLTTISAGNNTIVLGVIGALASLGLSVPRDISVIGFDELPFVSFIAPPLATVRVDATHQGRCAAKMLIGRLMGGPVAELRQVFK